MQNAPTAPVWPPWSWHDIKDLRVAVLQVAAQLKPIADPWHCGLNENPSGPRFGHAPGCFRISAKACNRAESPGLFAVAALCSRESAMPFNFASFLLFMWELSALCIAFCRSAIRSAGKASDRVN